MNVITPDCSLLREFANKDIKVCICLIIYSLIIIFTHMHHDREQTGYIKSPNGFRIYGSRNVLTSAEIYTLRCVNFCTRISNFIKFNSDKLFLEQCYIFDPWRSFSTTLLMCVHIISCNFFPLLNEPYLVGWLQYAWFLSSCQWY
jgi:hypothetical protein